MTEQIARIRSQEQIAQGLYDLWLTAPEIAKAVVPGQFVSVYSDDSAHLLPRPISLCGASDDAMRLVYRVVGAGTKELAGKRAGDMVRVLGPLGNGFSTELFSGGRHAALFGGGVGIPPMLFLAKRLSEAGQKVTAVLGYRDKETFLSEEFQAYATVLVSTEDGSVGTKGNVLTAWNESGEAADVFCACGPLPMLRALRTFSLEKEISCYLSLEERMACGIGACLGCVTATAETDPHSNVRNARVCKDGPVFLANTIEL